MTEMRLFRNSNQVTSDGDGVREQAIDIAALAEYALSVDGLFDRRYPRLTPRSTGYWPGTTLIDHREGPR